MPNNDVLISSKCLKIKNCPSETTIKCSHGFPQNNTLRHDGQVQHSKGGQTQVQSYWQLCSESRSFITALIVGLLLTGVFPFQWVLHFYSFLERSCSWDILLKEDASNSSREMITQRYSFACLSSLFCRERHLQEELVSFLHLYCQGF